jgi:hypothetical protein
VLSSKDLPEGKSSVSKTKLASLTPYKERAIMGDMKSVEVKIQHSYKRMKWEG